MRCDGLEEISQADDRGVRGVRPVDVTQYQRAWLDDAVDHGRVEGKVVDVERLVEIRERGGEPVRQPVPDVEVNLLQLVEHVGQLIGCRDRAARGNGLEVIAFRVAEIVYEPYLGVGADAWWTHVDREVVDRLGRVGRPVAQGIVELRG